jgi:hypothetical protein
MEDVPCKNSHFSHKGALRVLVLVFSVCEGVVIRLVHLSPSPFFTRFGIAGQIPGFFMR